MSPKEQSFLINIVLYVKKRVGSCGRKYIYPKNKKQINKILNAEKKLLASWAQICYERNKHVSILTVNATMAYFYYRTFESMNDVATQLFVVLFWPLGAIP